MKIRVAVIFGGKSVEHEVSVISGIQAIGNMDKEKYDIIPVYFTRNSEMFIGENIGDISAYKNINTLLKNSQKVIMTNENGRKLLVNYPARRFGKNPAVEFDVAFPIVHGTNVEDGALQGYLKTLGIPFVGCDVLSSAIGMDKYVMKTVLKDNQIPVLDCLCFIAKDCRDMEALLDKIEKAESYPVIVKPINLGSSVGISVAKNREQLTESIEQAFLFADKILVEHAISKLKEINCSVLGDVEDASASEVEEPFHTEDILSYKDKYASGSKGSSKGMASVQRKIPADISPELKKQIQEAAVKAFKCLGCNGVSRIDFMIDEENGTWYLNEINTIPGSLAFYLWEPIGVPYKELLDRLIKLAIKRMREEEKVTYSFDTNILSQSSLGGAKGYKR